MHKWKIASLFIAASVLCGSLMSGDQDTSGERFKKPEVPDAVKAAFEADDEATVPELSGPAEVTPGALITFTLELQPKEKIQWDIAPLGTQRDVRIVTSKGKRVAVLNFATGAQPNANDKTWTFVVSCYRFFGDSDDEDATVSRKQVLVKPRDPPKPPTPVDPPGPPTPVDPPTPPAPPLPGTGFRALIIYETDVAEKEAALSRTQLNIIASTRIRSYVNAKCVKGFDGKTPEFRQWDDDYTDASVKEAQGETWAAWYARARSDREQSATKKVPWLLASNGTAILSIPLPQTEDETLTALKKIGGE